MLEVLAYWPNDAPVVFYKTLRGSFLEREESLKDVGLRLVSSPFDPMGVAFWVFALWRRLYYIRNPNGRSVGAIATHFDDILG